MGGIPGSRNPVLYIKINLSDLIPGHESRPRALSNEVENLNLWLYLPCVQEVVTPIYIVTHYINWGNYFLDTQ